MGLAGYEEIMKTMRDEAITIPLCAIGGITLADVANIMSVGVDGIAVSGAVLNAADPVEEMKSSSMPTNPLIKAPLLIFTPRR